MEVKCKANDTLPIEELTEFQGNLKAREDSDVEKIIKSINKHGFSFPFFVWRHDGINHVLDGHGRLKALQRMVAHGESLPPLPVCYVDCKNENEAKEKLLKLNSTYGHMTAESVHEFLGDLEIDFEELSLPDGFLDLSAEMEKEMGETEGDDEVPEVNEEDEPDSVPGEMYALGDHILMCGDSTNADDVSRLMGGAKADMVFSDPPYNVAIGDKNKALQSFQPSRRIIKNIEGDAGQTDEDVGKNLWLPAFKNMLDNAEDECAIYITMPQGGTHMMMMMMMMKEAGWQVKHELIWVKNSPTFSMGRLNYDYQHEPILYGWKKTHKWVGKGKFNKSIWEIDKPKKCDLHPTMKPIELIENALLNSSEENDIILDLFGGSGSTLIACEKNNRKARLMELDPHYCDVIRKRWTKWAKDNGIEPGSGALE